MKSSPNKRVHLGPNHFKNKIFPPLLCFYFMRTGLWSPLQLKSPSLQATHTSGRFQTSPYQAQCIQGTAGLPESYRKKKSAQHARRREIRSDELTPKS